MCDIFDDDGADEELEFASREWNRLNNSLEKDGFRDGITEGREKGLQKAFEEGFKVSFGPFFTISTFEAIIDVLIFKLGSDKEKEEMVAELKSMKTNLIELYHLIDNYLITIETKNLDNIIFNDEIIDLFNKTKEKSITICNELNLESISQEMKQLSILEINS